MEKRIISRCKEITGGLKTNIISIIENDSELDIDMRKRLSMLIKNIPETVLNKDDFTRRKRSKSSVPIYLRCNAMRANGEQCSRKKKGDLEYCGTHEKNRPHGEFENKVADKEDELKKTEVYLTEINGIAYYIDENNNVYNSQDILENKEIPRKIGVYKNINNVYTILQ
tara:strand:+ start:2195 stop:2701 length:507 start_codon:yes stop_codon:yes gene_type:complete